MIPENRSRSSHKPSRGLAVAVLAAALGLLQCETRLAGSSVGTGNPTEIEVAFADRAGPITLSGRVEVFAASQIPVPGFSTEPLIRMNVAGGARVTLNAEAFLALGDSLWPESSLEGDSVRSFNVVATGDSQGAVIAGLRFAKKTGGFLLRPEDGLPKDGEAAKVIGAVRPLVEIRGRMDAGDLQPGTESFLFVYGTGFYAKGDAGRFVFPRMPSGEYETFLISYDKGNFPSGSESMDVFRLSGPIGPGDEALLGLSGIQERIPIPDSLKAK